MPYQADKKRIWECKETDEVDMTTTGSALNPNNLTLYAKMLSETLLSNDTFTLSEHVPYVKTCGSDAKQIILDLLKDLHVALDSREPISYQQDADRLIRTLIAKLEKSEILSLLEDNVMTLLSREHRGVVVDIASGIGRFIPYFSENFSSVIQIDFSECNIRKAQELNKDIENVEYRIQNIMSASFEDSTLDCIFGNWILQYLEDHEVETLVSRTYAWLKPGGTVFFREGIKTNYEGIVPPKSENPAHFRNSADVYNDWFRRAYFQIVKEGNLKTYETVFNNPNQRYWILKK
jgi:SAM-dependent methyltransferase